MTKPKLGHRERIIEGMVQASARYGYGGASVARVIRHAGVSRATFYEHFADKEACFLAAFRQAAQRMAGALDTDAKDRRRAVLANLLARTERDPAAARVVLFEALAAGQSVREEHAQQTRAIEQVVDNTLDYPAEDGTRIELPARALLGGVGSVIAIRAYRGETGRLSGLLDDLLAWLNSYAVPADQRRLNAADWDKLGEVLSLSEPLAKGEEHLPRGRSALPPPVVTSKQRERILIAAARLAREKGYAAMTVADIVATAGISREAFYDQFRNKEDAFLAVQAFVLENSMAVAASSFFSEADWPSRIWSSAVAMLRFISQQPDLACAEFVESYAAGDAAIRRSFDTRMAYTLFLEDGYRQRPEAERLPRLCSEAIAGAILELFRRETVEGRTERTLEMTPQGVYVALAPFIGPAAAIEQVEAKLVEPGATPAA